MNQFVLTGKVKENFTYNYSKKYTVLKLASKYIEEDIIIYIKVPNAMISKAISYIRVGDLFGVKGHFESKGLKHRSLICDKLTFLSGEASK